jgi:hypothetical protein
MKRAEDTIQRTICQHLRKRAERGVVWWSAANNPRSARDGARLKAMGLRAGISDLFFIKRGNLYALELKAENGRETEAQMQFRSDVNAAGGFATVAHGLDKAIKILESWGIIR